MSEERTFYCLRCQARFPQEHDTAKVVERTCPQCGSNSVRLETELARKAREAKGVPKTARP